LVREYWCRAILNREMDKARSVVAPDCIWNFKDAEASLKFSEMMEACLLIAASFPDLKVYWDAVQEIAPNVVMVKSFRGTGTHTGAPFFFGPFPPISATGIYVEEDPCHMTFTIRNGKYINVEADCYSGDLVGPPGFYHKIGGKMM
jgi:hypothetical protein